MRFRWAGIALAIGALALCVLPALTWFSAATPRGRVGASGLDIAGVLWLVPPLALAVGLAGVWLVVVPAERAITIARWAGPLAAGAGVLALVAVLWAGGDPQAVLTVRGEVVATELAERIQREPASWLATGAAMSTLLIGVLTGLAAWRR